MNTRKHIVLLLSVLLNVIFILIVYFQLDTAELYMLISSDTLYLPLLFRDIFMDHARDVIWYVPPATCFFPDLVIYFLVNFLFKNFIVAKFVTGIIFCGLLGLGFYLLIKKSIDGINPVHISIGFNLMLLFHMAALSAGDFFFTFYLTATNYHLGAYIVSLFCFYLVILYLKNRKLSTLLIFLLLYIITLSSDFLTISHLTVPLAVAGILLLLKKRYRLPAIYLLVANGLGFILGYLLYQGVKLSKTITILSMQDIAYLKISFQNAFHSYSVMLNYHFLFIKSLDVRTVMLLLCIISFVISLVMLVRKLWTYFQKNEISHNDLLELMYLLLVVGQVVVLYNAPAISGIFNGIDQMRYNVYVFFILILHYAYLFYKGFVTFGLQKYTRLFSIALLILFSFFCLKAFIRTEMKQGARNLFSHYPDYVEKVDELCKQHDIKYGLADFWLAKPITMLSKNDLRVYQVYDDGNPYPHVVNLNWYYGTEDGKTPPTVFEFIMMNNVNDSVIYKKLVNHIIDTLKNDDITLVKVSPFIFTRETWSDMTFVNDP